MKDDINYRLSQHLTQTCTTLAWCWRIERTDGWIQGFTNHDRDVRVNRLTYQAASGFLGTEIESQLGMAVDNMDVFGAVDSSIITEGDLRNGLYDLADIRIYLVNWKDPTQYVLMKKGTLGQIKRGRVMFEAELRSIATEAQQTKGKILQYTCPAILGDDKCGKTGLTGATYTGSGTVLSTDTSLTITASGLGSYTDGWFTRGKLTWTSGGNNGISAEVKLHVKGTDVAIDLWEPTQSPIEAGDTFSILAGCDKTFKTCKAKFSNYANFRGYPHVPGASTMATYAVRGTSTFDGGGNFLGED